MIIIKDLHYEYNKVEMIINIGNKQFDGEIHKAIINVKFKFGIRCCEKDSRLIKEFPQEIHQEILWTEYDISGLSDQVNEIININTKTSKKEKNYIQITLFEQEFEGLCFVYTDDFLILYISVGISGMGPTIKLTTTKAKLNEWVENIKEEFYN